MMVRKLQRFIVSLFVVGLVAGAIAERADAGSAGLVSTDRFGYDGTIKRYSTLADAQAGTNSVDTIDVDDRDLSLFIANDDISVSDYNIAMGSWWYTTDPQGRAGWGNTRGNTGVGFLQLFDEDGSTDTNVEMSFGGFDGTHYTSFDLVLEGANAAADDFARLSAIDNVNDGGIWHEYALSLTATGLQGTEIGPGVIESTNQPTAVTGSLTGLFEITENQTSPANQGFYTVDFDLTMTNWAWENRNDLMTQDEDGNPIPDDFAPSTFRAVPVPGAGVAGLAMIGGLGLLRRRRHAA